MPKAPLPAFYEDLTLSREVAWELLLEAARTRRTQMHLITLATLGLDGTPQARTVVLRGVDPVDRRLRVHTDRRAPKIREIAANPAVSVLAYDPEAKIQLRLSGIASVQDEAMAGLWWRTSKPMSRECYRAPFPPGDRLSDPAAGDVPPLAAPGVADDAQPGRENFVALSIQCHAIDWLFLAVEGHRRAHFTWTGDAWDGHWVGP